MPKFDCQALFPAAPSLVFESTHCETSVIWMLQDKLHSIFNAKGEISVPALRMRCELPQPNPLTAESSYRFLSRILLS